MKQLVVRHAQCPKCRVGDDIPVMVLDTEDPAGSTIYVSPTDKGVLVIRLCYVCPECGFTVFIDI